MADSLHSGRQSTLWAPVPALWCCAFVHVSDWVNNHAEKPYVQSEGCPTFEKMMRGGIWVGCQGGDTFNCRTMPKKRADHMVIDCCGEKAHKIMSLLLFCGCKCAKRDIDASCAGSRATPPRPTFISFSINDMCISRTSSCPAGSSIPAQLPWVRTYHSMSAQPSLTPCSNTELCQGYKESWLFIKASFGNERNLICNWQQSCFTPFPSKILRAV